MVGSAGPLLVQAFEVRPYALAFFFSAAALWCALRIGRDEGGRIILSANALCSFALPFLSYPSGLFSAALLFALAAQALWERRSISLKMVASFASGWFFFLLVGGKYLLAQVAENRMGLTHAAPHLGDLFAQYTTVVSFPLGVVAVLIFELGTKAGFENHRLKPTPDPMWRADPMWMTLSWLAVPICLFVTAKSGLAVVWGDRYVLPVTIAIIMAVAPFLAAVFRERGSPGPWTMSTIAVAAMASLVASGLSLRGANRETPVRRLAAAMPEEFRGLPLVVSEMNSFFHLLHYGKPALDTRLYARSAANQALLLRVNPSLRPITAGEVARLQHFVMLVNADRSWANDLKADFAAHGLAIKEIRPLSNEFIKEFWVVGRIAPQ